MADTGSAGWLSDERSEEFPARPAAGGKRREWAQPTSRGAPFLLVRFLWVSKENEQPQNNKPGL